MNTLCCHWCKIPLGNASQVTYLNGNLPICDLCLSKDKRIAELEKKYEAYKISNYDPSESIRLNGEIMHQKNRIAELEAQVEKLKCCGNCTSFMIDDHHVLYCENDVYPFPILGKCDRWEASHAATPLRRMGL